MDRSGRNQQWIFKISFYSQSTIDQSLAKANRHAGSRHRASREPGWEANTQPPRNIVENDIIWISPWTMLRFGKYRALIQPKAGTCRSNALRINTAVSSTHPWGENPCLVSPLIHFLVIHIYAFFPEELCTCKDTMSMISCCTPARSVCSFYLSLRKKEALDIYLHPRSPTSTSKRNERADTEDQKVSTAGPCSTSPAQDGPWVKKNWCPKLSQSIHVFHTVYSTYEEAEYISYFARFSKANESGLLYSSPQQGSKLLTLGVFRIKFCSLSAAHHYNLQKASKAFMSFILTTRTFWISPRKTGCASQPAWFDWIACYQRQKWCCLLYCYIRRFL